jgi:hypothetical protein
MTNRKSKNGITDLIKGTGILKLRPDPAGGNRHYNGLARTDFVIAQAFFPGYTKVMRHSRIATNGHGRCQVQHQGGLGLQDFIVARRVIKLSVRFLLLFR